MVWPGSWLDLWRRTLGWSREDVYQCLEKLLRGICCLVLSIHFEERRFCFPAATRFMKALRRCLISVAVALFSCSFTNDALEVRIDYSFYLPEEFGNTTVESANCCPYQKLPNSDSGSMMVPSIVGIGAQKSGTTTLFEHLKRHPQLLASAKELNFLADSGNETFQSYLKRWKANSDGLDSITDKAGNVRTIKALFEITPSYMYIPFAACKAKHLLPDAKFIVFLRDPVDRAYSAFSFTKSVVHRDTGKTTKWMRQSFWYQVQHALLEIEEEPACNFRTGKGEHSYNDCARCVLRSKDASSSCEYRPFVTLVDDALNYECQYVGRETVLRGMYAAQLAWWFTLFDPSQFNIVDFDTFKQEPLSVMKDIGKFLELTPTYTQELLDSSMEKVNVGGYKGAVDLADVQKTKDFLREYYKRPNLELYRLLHETGHGGHFKPFEDELKKRDFLDCTDPETIQTGICGRDLAEKNAIPSNPAETRKIDLPPRPFIDSNIAMTFIFVFLCGFLGYMIGKYLP